MLGNMLSRLSTPSTQSKVDREAFNKENVCRQDIPSSAKDTWTPERSESKLKSTNPNLSSGSILVKRKNSALSSIKKKGGRLIRNLTPPRHLDVGCGTTPKRLRVPGEHLVAPLTLSPKFKDAKDYEIRSCELQPSEFQVEVPIHENVLATCRLCTTLDNYVELGGVDFDFSNLMLWVNKKSNDTGNAFFPEDLNALLMGEDENSDGNAANTKSSVSQTDGTKDYAIMSNLQEAVEDIVVEGFFREYYDDEHLEDGLGRVEVCIFSSLKCNKFFVVYRGSSDVQDRPINGMQEKEKFKEQKSAKKKEVKGEINSTLVKSSVEKDLNSRILNAYNCNLEDSVFTLLNRLTGLRPFCDVTVLGHSFGGALATIMAYKYAKSRPASRIRCHAFGSPKVGGELFRNEVHSLPNLNILRIERSTDPFISMPEGTEWEHVGHTLRMSLNTLASLTVPTEVRPVEFQLYKFDKGRPTGNFVSMSVNTVSNLRKLKIGNEIKSYQKDLDKVKTLNLTWVNSFVGFETAGEKICSGYFA